jgi:hypothetical protein
MNNQLSIAYRLAGAGWADCTLESDGTSAKVSASYLSNALGNLVLSAVAVASGFRITEFGFDEEPGEYRWVIEAVDNSVIRLRILEFKELWGMSPTKEVALSSRSPRRRFCMQRPFTHAPLVCLKCTGWKATQKSGSSIHFRSENWRCLLMQLPSGRNDA